jgi:hypothetical protein
MRIRGGWWLFVVANLCACAGSARREKVQREVPLARQAGPQLAICAHRFDAIRSFVCAPVVSLSAYDPDRTVDVGRIIHEKADQFAAGGHASPFSSEAALADWLSTDQFLGCGGKRASRFATFLTLSTTGSFELGSDDSTTADPCGGIDSSNAVTDLMGDVLIDGDFAKLVGNALSVFQNDCGGVTGHDGQSLMEGGGSGSSGSDGAPPDPGPGSDSTGSDSPGSGSATDKAPGVKVGDAVVDKNGVTIGYVVAVDHATGKIVYEEAKANVSDGDRNTIPIGPQGPKTHVLEVGPKSSMVKTGLGKIWAEVMEKLTGSAIPKEGPAYATGPGVRGDCIVDMPCATECSRTGFAEALATALASRRGTKCNNNATPHPDDTSGTCYNILHGTKATAEMIRHLWEAACQERQTAADYLDGSAACGFPPQSAKGRQFADACNDPRAMCTGDDLGFSTGGLPPPGTGVGGRGSGVPGGGSGFPGSGSGIPGGPGSGMH